MSALRYATVGSDPAARSIAKDQDGTGGGATDHRHAKEVFDRGKAKEPYAQHLLWVKDPSAHMAADRVSDQRPELGGGDYSEDDAALAP